MRRFAMQFVLLVSVLAVTVSTARSQGRVGVGDFEFFMDTATFRLMSPQVQSDLRRQDVYIRIPNSEARFKERNGQQEANILLSVTITDVDGIEIVSDKEELTFAEPDTELATSRLRFQTVIRKYELPPGSYLLSCVLSDLNSPKISMVGMARGSHKSSKIVDHEFDVQSFAMDPLALSDVRFLWSIEDDEGRHHTNPSRLYGLYKDVLQAYVEVYLPEDFDRPEELQLQALILDERGDVFSESTFLVKNSPSFPVAGSTSFNLRPVLIAEDLNTFPAGSYTLYLDVGYDDQPLVRVRCGNFSVAWDIRTWEISRRTYLSEARFLMDDQEFAEFTKLSIGDQEVALQELWKQTDPDPTTGVNEAYEEFLTRLAYVNAHYSDYQLGIFTDRGLIFLRYGPPDEVVVDVVPMNRESISDALSKVEDRFHTVNFSNTGARMKYTRPGQNIAVDPRRIGMVGEGGDVAFPYELWVYNDSGKPILERDRSLEADLGIRFIFVDRDGYGRYRLESSSSMSGK